MFIACYCWLYDLGERLSVDPERCGEFSKPINDEVVMCTRFGVRRARNAPFVWAPNERRIEPTRFGRIQVEVVASHHAQFARVEL